MKLEEAKKQYEEIKRNKECIKCIDKDYFLMFAETVLEALENSIPKEVIEKAIKKYKKEYEEILSEYGNIDTEVIINVPNENVRKYLDELIIKWTTLQEILEGK